MLDSCVHEKSEVTVTHGNVEELDQCDPEGSLVCVEVEGLKGEGEELVAVSYEGLGEEVDVAVAFVE